MRSERRYPLSNPKGFKARLLNWAGGSECFCWLDSNGHTDPLGRFDGLLGIGKAGELLSGARGAFQQLSDFRENTGDWLLGYLAYDLKNDLEALESTNPDRLGFPDLFFFQPLKLVEIVHNTAIFRYLPEVAGEIQGDWEAIGRTPESLPIKSGEPLRTRMGIFKEAYHRSAREILSAIHRGDIYEANFCQEFFVEGARLDTPAVFRQLNSISRPPFAAWLRFGTRHIFSASPERYLTKRGQQVWSQPMKGTAPRHADTKMDGLLAQTLQSDPKERAENIMIADLVRNDLSRSALRGSVQVEALCELKTFAQVHQLVSTIRAQVPGSLDPVQLLRDSFPMGSMTGAPKISAMAYIERLESFKRGPYSGALGYFGPNGDFDFSVVIRSLLYDSEKRVASFPVGGALTAAADPDREYEECLLKARAMRQVLEEQG
ncbi:anthranilate synthase component I family protein [Robiginitalea sp. SC105]|uniref:anthranilate synthase component I family protein n=1 Tax=Robiginitalea sp. SC105 TaxID=2762332 RepID=UPI00163A79D1|nr:anthranilate synthase component I family protein [Robiginitalea sp. SC105]MBC2840435.1 anthranilate synthase component I family protein [Robiginitalea sp. SC105]